MKHHSCFCQEHGDRKTFYVITQKEKKRALKQSAVGLTALERVALIGAAKQVHPGWMERT